MNPMTNMKNVKKLSEQELARSSKTSWHDQYKDSAWIFVGGLPYDLTEGDIICIFSQYGEIVNINLIRAKDTGKSKGFCFICYEDQRSTILAVDNFNGIKILKRTIRVDHVAEYKVPKEGKNTDEETKKLYSEGCAPKVEPVMKKNESIKSEPQDSRQTAIEPGNDIRLPFRLPIYTDIKEEIKEEPDSDEKKLKKKKSKKKKSNKEKKHKKSKHSDTDSIDESSSEDEKRHTTLIRSKEKGRHHERKRDTERYNSPDRNTLSKRRSRSRSRDKDDNKIKYKRSSSPYVPKRYRN